MENQTDINVLIIRLISGEANAAEKSEIEQWLSQSAENKKLYADIREIWLSSGNESNADNYDLEGAILNFRKHISANNLPQARNIGFRQFAKYAAAIAFLLALPLSYYLGQHNRVPDESMTTISCAFGDKSSIVLPDSSRVWLNSGSTISFSSNFKQKERNVYLEGEAFFKVAKDKLHPFRVKASDIQVEVLGTQFNLKAYPEERLISTTLVEGSLLVSGKTQKTKIKPDEKLIFDKASNKMSLVVLDDTSAETEWKDGRFVFRNESLGELAPKLKRWFDVEVIFADEQARQRRFTGILEHENILEAISYFDQSTLINCKIEGNKIVIKSENN